MKTLKTRILVPIIVLIGVIVANVIFRSNSLTIIQEEGVKAYNNILSTINIATIVLGILCVGSMAFFIISSQKSKKKKEILEAKRQLEEEKRQKAMTMEKAKYAPNNSLDDDYIYEHLQEWQSKDWGQKFPVQIGNILHQMDDMNRYQGKLNKLITNNGAKYLNDSTEVLDNVEQYILRNVRKLLNCFDIYEATDISDTEKMQELLDKIEKDNTVQLYNVKEFLFAATDFVNQQGDDNTDIKKLNIYKETIISSLKEDSDETILKL